MEDDIEVIGDRLGDVVGVGEVGLDELGAVGDAVAVALREVVGDANRCAAIEELRGEVAPDEPAPPVTSAVESVRSIRPREAASN